MHVLVVEITSPSGDYHKTLPISEQAANDPARRGNLIRTAAMSYVDGKATSWKVLNGDRIIAQSKMKDGLTAANPGIADHKLTQGDADYVSALTGAPLQTVEDDPFDIPKTVDIEQAGGNKIGTLSLADVPVYENQKSKANVQKIASGLEERRANWEAAFQVGVDHATEALKTNSAVNDFQTPFGDGGNGQDTSLRDAYEAGYNSVVNTNLTDDQRSVWAASRPLWGRSIAPKPYPPNSRSLSGRLIAAATHAPAMPPSKASRSATTCPRASMATTTPLARLSP